MSGGERKLEYALDVSLRIMPGSAGFWETAQQMPAPSEREFLKLITGAMEVNFVEVSGMVERMRSLVNREPRNGSK